MSLITLRTPRVERGSVSLRRLLPEAEFFGFRDLLVSGVTANARDVMPGFAYVAIDSSSADLTLASEHGAYAIITSDTPAETGPSLVVTNDLRSAFARIIQGLYGEPSRWISVLGMTGHAPTSQSSRFLRSILEADGRSVGLAGLSDDPSTQSLDATAVASDLASLVDRRCNSAILRIDAESLALRAADGVQFDAALIVSPTGPGIDDRAALRAMARMTRSVRPGGVIAVDLDDDHVSLLPASNIESGLVTFGLTPKADVWAQLEPSEQEGLRFSLMGLDRKQQVELRECGESALRAALGAAAIARGMGLSDGAIVAGLESVDSLIWKDDARAETDSVREWSAFSRRSA